MNHVAFILTMPNVGSWNGKWSGESNLYAVVKKFGGKKGAARAESLKGDYYYNFGDGWGANVEAKPIDGVTARKMKKASKGFCGYEWMIESILEYGKILADHQKPEAQEVAA